MNEMQSTSGESTPITADGLRGLGMTHYVGCTFEWYRLKVPNRMFNVYRFESEMPFSASLSGDPRDYREAVIGTAPDLEAVADLIDVLRRMNGGGT